MERKLKILRYITIGLAAVAIGLLIASAAKRDTLAADALKETDRFIEEHSSWKKIEPETVALSYEEYLAYGNSNDFFDNCISGADSADHPDYLDDVQAAVEEAQNELTPDQFRTAGVYYWNGWRFTWYSEQVLPGDGLDIPSRWSDGDFVRDGNGYLCVACNDLEHGSVVATPFGDAVIYDAIGDGVTGTIDIYVSW